MTRLSRTRRAGFTLVELLVAIAIIIALASIALLVVPGALDQDRTVDGAATVRQALASAKAQAARDQRPRGVRFVTGLDPTHPDKTNPLWSTEMQYLEAPPILVMDPAPNADPILNPSPQIQFVYTTGNPPNAVIAGRECRFYLPGVYAGVGPQIQATASPSTPYTLIIPSLGPSGSPFYTKVVGFTPGPGGAYYVANVLTWPDDAALGAETMYNTFLFGLYAPPRPLMGERNVPLPDKICVDLTQDNGANIQNPTTPQIPLTDVGTGYDIVFAPNGSVVLGPGATTGQIMLWVRNYTKTPNALVRTAPGTYDMTPFFQGGEQMIVALKSKSGALGAFPVKWPDNQATGQYINPPPPGQPYSDPYTFARQGVTGQ